MLDVIRDFYKEGFKFNGRVARSTFWMTILYLFLVGALLRLGTVALDDFFGNEQPYITAAVFGIIGIISIIPSISLEIKRLHDINKSGLWILLSFIPFGSIILLIFYCMPSVYSGNNY